MLYRIGYNLLVLGALLYLPYPSLLCFLLAGFFLYSFYFEGLVWGVVIDAMLATGGLWWYTSATIIMFVVSYLLKPYIKYYD